MFRPTLIDIKDPDHEHAANNVPQLLNDLVAACQRQGWRPDAHTTELTVSTWASSMA